MYDLYHRKMYINSFIFYNRCTIFISFLYDLFRIFFFNKMAGKHKNKKTNNHKNNSSSNNFAPKLSEQDLCDLVS
jgi:hypothetical protein